MSEKIAILSQPLGHNYGGIIQNYALQTILKERGYNPVTINRKKVSNGAPYFLNNIKSLIKFYYRNGGKGIPATSFVINKIYKENIRFMNEYLNVSEPIFDNLKFKKFVEKEKFGIYIVGSDQVWRPKYSPNIYTYYLDFIQDALTKKLIYAASFGTDEWEYSREETEKCQALVQNLDAISVRELDGVDLCKEHLKVDALHVLDPTLLLDANNYDSLIKNPTKNMGLFSYILDDGPEKIEFINNCARILKIDTSKSQALSLGDKRSQNIKDFIVPPIENWLQGFRDAEFVITDSFHGTVFSIINRKPFYSIINSKRGASRFYSLLGMLNLQDRIINDVSNFDFKGLHNVINYDEVFKKLNFERKKSMDFLFSNLVK